MMLLKRGRASSRLRCSAWATNVPVIVANAVAPNDTDRLFLNACWIPESAMSARYHCTVKPVHEALIRDELNENTINTTIGREKNPYAKNGTRPMRALFGLRNIDNFRINHQIGQIRR